MITELSIIKYFLNYSVWNNYKDYLGVNDFPREVQGIIRVLNNFHTEHPDNNISVNDLANLYFSQNIPNKEFMLDVFDNLNALDCNETTVKALITGIKTNNIMREISLTAYDVAEGRKSRDDVQKLFDQLSVAKTETEESFEFVTSDIDELISHTVSATGLRWRLDTLNKMLGSLRKGDFGFLFARPETGKTTFLASEVTHMASQASAPILWLNLEEQGEKVMLRCVQAALGITLEQLYKDVAGAKKRFYELTNHNIRIYDSASISQHTVEKLVKQLKPSLIVIDQLDKIQSKANDREDLRLGALYIWARELAKEYCPVIAVSQADGTGEGVRWLTMAHVANAKTSKQAEADFILGIGKSNEPGYDNLRFFHLSKNKLMGDSDSDPTLRHGRKETIIRPEIARYEDIQ